MSELTGVWGRSASDVWVVGAGGLTLHWDGTAWSRVATDSYNNLRSISGSGGVLRAVGEGGTILRRM
jgi:hypothetical protein